MRTQNLVAGLFASSWFAMLGASCLQAQEAPPPEASPSVETLDDNPNLGGSIGGDVGSDTSFGSDPSVGHESPPPMPANDAPPPVNYTPSGDEESVSGVIHCLRSDYGKDCLQQCKDAAPVNVCRADWAAPNKSVKGTGLLAGCSWNLTLPTGCAYFYAESHTLCTWRYAWVKPTCEWSP